MGASPGGAGPADGRGGAAGVKLAGQRKSSSGNRFIRAERRGRWEEGIERETELPLGFLATGGITGAGRTTWRRRARNGSRSSETPPLDAPAPLDLEQRVD